MRLKIRVYSISSEYYELYLHIAMPLWSNEEWRARIGSCWCVLGRPSRKSSSPFHRQRASDITLVSWHIPGEIALQVISMLLTLTMAATLSGIGMIKVHVKGLTQGKAVCVLASVTWSDTTCV